MEALRIPSTIKTPEVLFDPTHQVFEIKGKSIPDDAEDFYAAVLQWFEDYVANPCENTVLKIDLEYFNISSSKRLLFLLYKLNELKAKNKTVRVQWLYNEEDEDMFEVGQDYAFMVKVPFDFISYTMNQRSAVVA
ncbi:MAG: DUF1987 domain-containing protein [Crocinitomicaceae bacterium]|jgi:hypothetical protein|nr:DUF1987 domain-containing protein [Crocinitomicaceae bacterium]